LQGELFALDAGHDGVQSVGFGLCSSFAFGSGAILRHAGIRIFPDTLSTFFPLFFILQSLLNKVGYCITSNPASGSVTHNLKIERCQDMLSLNKNHTKSVIATAGFIIGVASIGIPVIRYIFFDLEP
jgi:hypothetical protein